MSKKKAKPSLAQDKKLIGLLAFAAAIIIGLLIWYETSL